MQERKLRSNLSPFCLCKKRNFETIYPSRSLRILRSKMKQSINKLRIKNVELRILNNFYGLLRHFVPRKDRVWMDYLLFYSSQRLFVNFIIVSLKLNKTKVILIKNKLLYHLNNSLIAYNFAKRLKSLNILHHIKKYLKYTTIKV